MPQLHKTTDLKVLAILGGLVYVGMFVGLIGLIVWTMQQNFSSGTFQEPTYPGQVLEEGNIEEAPVQPEAVKKAGLGSEGSVCGGTERLPCMPGLQCAVSKGESMGVCAKITPLDNQPVLQ